MSIDTPQDAQVDEGQVPDDPLTDHSYDGIREFDNPMPGWWKWLFVGSIFWSALYWLYYENGLTPDRSVIASYDRAVAANQEKQFAKIGELTPDPATIVEFSQKPEWVAFGKALFQTNCVSCHGPNAEGKIGPNLTDTHWKNVKSVEDIYKVINNGANGNAMPAWGERLKSQNKVILLASYVVSLQGSVPEGSGLAPIKGETHVIPDLLATAPAAEKAENGEETDKDELSPKDENPMQDAAPKDEAAS